MTLLNLEEVDEVRTDAEHWNKINDALSGDILPRDADGVASAGAGELGTSTFPFLRAEIISAYCYGGFLIPWYDYAGAVPLPQGYMLCNGDQVTRVKYNEQHRSSISDTFDYWATYVESSPVENLYTPDMRDRHLKGTTGTLQSGITAITPSGNIGNTINLSHNHGGSAPTALVSNVSSPQMGNDGVPTASVAYPMAYNTNFGHSHSAAIPSALGSVDITPVSITLKFLIRIVE